MPRRTRTAEQGVNLHATLSRTKDSRTPTTSSIAWTGKLSLRKGWHTSLPWLTSDYKVPQTGEQPCRPRRSVSIKCDCITTTVVYWPPPKSLEGNFRAPKYRTGHKRRRGMCFTALGICCPRHISTWILNGYCRPNLLQTGETIGEILRRD